MWGHGGAAAGGQPAGQEGGLGGGDVEQARGLQQEAQEDEHTARGALQRLVAPAVSAVEQKQRQRGDGEADGEEGVDGGGGADGVLRLEGRFGGGVRGEEERRRQDGRTTTKLAPHMNVMAMIDTSAMIFLLQKSNILISRQNFY